MGEDPIEQKRVARAVPTFAQFIEDQYLPHVRSYKKSWETDVSLLKNHLLPRFGTRYMDEISRQDIVKMHSDRRASGAAPGSANRLLIMMRYIFNLALRWEVPGIKGNPTKNVPLMAEDNKKERYLNEDEARRLYEAVCDSENTMLKYIVPMLILTGARKREVLDAKWEDFDFDRRLWRIPTTKLGKPRHVPLSDGVLNLLSAMERKGDWVFANPKTNKPFVSIFCGWNTARKKAGLADVRVHDLRHSFASLLINSGRSLYEVQKLLGHTQIRTTQRYAHLAPETLLAASNAATLAVGSIMGVMPNRVVEVPMLVSQ
jgi:integrase